VNNLVDELLGNSRMAQKTNEKGNENMGMSHVCDGIKLKDREELSNKKAGPMRSSFVLLHVLKNVRILERIKGHDEFRESFFYFKITVQ